MPSRWANMGAQMGGGVSNALGGYARNKRMDNEFEKVKKMGMGTDEQNLYMQMRLGAAGGAGNELNAIIAEMLRRKMGGGGGARSDVGGGNAAGAGGAGGTGTPNVPEVPIVSLGTYINPKTGEKSTPSDAGDVTYLTGLGFVKQ